MEENKTTGLDFAYCRVSTGGQDLHRQVIAMQALGIPDDRIIQEKISGTMPAHKRPKLRHLIEHLLRPGDRVWVVSTSRLSRELFHFLELVKMFNEMGVEFKAMDMQIDATHPIGKFLFNIMGAVSQLQSDFTRYRTKKGLEAARLRGVKLGRKAGPSADMVEFRKYFMNFADPFEAIKASCQKYSKTEVTIRRWAKSQGIAIPRKRKARKLKN